MPFVMFMPDAAVQNTWLLYRSSSSHENEPMDLLSLRREIVNMTYSSRQQNHIFSSINVLLFSGKSNEKCAPSEDRFDGRHYQLSNPTQGIVLIVVKIQSTFAVNVILDFTLIVLKVIMKM